MIVERQLCLYILVIAPVACSLQDKLLLLRLFWIYKNAHKIKTVLKKKKNGLQVGIACANGPNGTSQAPIGLLINLCMGTEAHFPQNNLNSRYLDLWKLYL